MSNQTLLQAWIDKKASGRLNASFQRETILQLKRWNRLPEKKLNEQANAVHDAVFEKIDCLQCANCCKSIPPILNDADIQRLARALRIKVSVFKQQYTRVDEDGDTVMNQSPCPFLGHDHYCSVYEHRPRACRAYPHTNDFEFKQNMRLHAVNATYCPAVYHIIEQLKALI